MQKSDNDDINKIIETFDSMQKKISELEDEKGELEERIVKLEMEKGESVVMYESQKWECDRLLKIISEIHRQLQQSMDMEDKKKQFEEQCNVNAELIKQLQEELTAREAEYDVKIKEMREECEGRITEAVSIKEMTERKKQTELELRISQHEQTINDITQRCEVASQNHEANIVSLTMQYESKLSKLQARKVTSSARNSSMNQEIFRQKQRNMREEYEARIAALQKSNDELSQRVAIFERVESSRSSLSLSNKRHRP